MWTVSAFYRKENDQNRIFNTNEIFPLGVVVCENHDYCLEGLELEKAECPKLQII